MKILYVEDDPRDADLTQRELNKTAPHISLKTVGTCADALARLGEPDVSELDLVLTDFWLPDGNGMDILIHILEQGLPLAVVVITGSGDEETVVAVMKAGADDYIVKRGDYLERLPLALKAALENYRAGVARRTTPLRVIYAEHNTADIDLTRRHLAHHAPYIHLETVHTASEVLACFPAGKTPPIDAILLDYRLPGMSALDVLKELRQARELDIPIVLVTGQGDEETALQALKIGACDYIPKHPGYLYRISSALENAYHRTQLRREQCALQASEEKYRDLVENINDVIFTTDREGRITYISPVIHALAGYDPSELIGKNFAEFIHKDDLPEIAAAFEKVLSGRLEPRDYRIINKSGQPIWVRSYSKPIISGDQVIGLRGILSDITERKKSEQKHHDLEAQLFQAQKMESVGRLAGGVAHDFNNILSIILGYGEMLLEDIPTDHPYANGLKEIQEAAVRAKNLTRQLLAFGRKQLLEIKVTNINKIISDFEKMLHRLISEDVVLKLSLTTNPALVKVDISQIEQILLNLVVNALDALPQGGVLAIETDVIALDDDYIIGKTTDIAPGPYVVISVSDTGIGMDKETLARIFEPFYTTKEKDKGTGLGLSTVYGIVKQHGGDVWVYSETGQGSVFKIYLPRVAEDVKETAVDIVPQAHLKSGETTILVVEDEESVRKLTCTILQRQGYTVIESKSVDDAIALARSHKGKIHLLLTDVVMPGMKGPDVHKQIAAHHPETRALYMSGYSEELFLQKEFLGKDIHFIQKPFSISELIIKVTEVLSR